MKTFDISKPESMEPIPIKKLGNDIIFVDGHTRAYAAFLHGFFEVPVYWEDEELDWDAYEICVGWCKKEGIHTIADLKNRVVSQKDYEILWYRRCEKMQQDLAQEKRKKNTCTKGLSAAVVSSALTGTVSCAASVAENMNAKKAIKTIFLFTFFFLLSLRG